MGERERVGEPAKPRRGLDARGLGLRVGGLGLRVRGRGLVVRPGPGVRDSDLIESERSIHRRFR